MPSMKRVTGTVSPQISAAAATAGAPSATANPTTIIRIERAPLMRRPAATVPRPICVKTRRRRRSPGLALACLDERAQAADEVPPPLHDGLGRIALPARVLERDFGGLSVGHQRPVEGRADP